MHETPAPDDDHEALPQLEGTSIHAMVLESIMDKVIHDNAQAMRWLGDHDPGEPMQFQVTWSVEDREYVATVTGFPSFSWLDPDPVQALAGLTQVLSEEAHSAGRGPLESAVAADRALADDASSAPLDAARLRADLDRDPITGSSVTLLDRVLERLRPDPSASQVVVVVRPSGDGWSAEAFTGEAEVPDARWDGPTAGAVVDAALASEPTALVVVQRGYE